MLSSLVTLNPLPLTKSLQALTKAAVTKKTLREPGWVRLGLWMSRCLQAGPLPQRLQPPGLSLLRTDTARLLSQLEGDRTGEVRLQSPPSLLTDKSPVSSVSVQFAVVTVEVMIEDLLISLLFFDYLGSDIKGRLFLGGGYQEVGRVADISHGVVRGIGEIDAHITSHPLKFLLEIQQETIRLSLPSALQSVLPDPVPLLLLDVSLQLRHGQPPPAPQTAPRHPEASPVHWAAVLQQELVILHQLCLQRDLPRLVDDADPTEEL